MLKTIFLYCICLVLIANFSFAQDPIAVKLTEKEGLPDVEFYDIIEDSKGFIWLAADKGLYRFDGKEYVSYTNKDKRGLSVFGLKFDNQNQLWCNNISGQFFYIKNNKLELFLDLKNELKGELAEFIFFENKLYVFTVSSIFSIDFITKKREQIVLPARANYPVIRAPFKHKEQIYFTVNNEIVSLNKFGKIEVLKTKFNDLEGRISPKLFEHKNSFYLLLYNSAKNKNTFFKIEDYQFREVFFPKELHKNRIVTIAEREGNLWFSTSNGIFIVNEIKDKFYLNTIYFADDFITKTISDSNKTIWVSTLNNGIFIIPNQQIKNYKKNIDNAVISVIEKISDSKIVIGTTKGNLYLIDLVSGKKEEIVLDKRKISALLFLKESNVLIISTEGNSYAYNINNKKLSEIEGINNAKDLFQIGNSNKFIFCGFDRAAIFKFEKNIISVVKFFDYTRAYRSYFDTDTKETYLSYVDNVIVYDSIFSSKKLKYKDKSINAKDICQTADKMVWIATFTDGLLGFKNNQFSKKIDVDNGLQSNIIQEIKCDDNDLWIVTDKGIQIYNSLEGNFKHSLVSNNNTLGNNRGIIINDKSVLFASQDQLFKIDKSIQPKEYRPKEIYIKSILINEKDTLIQEHYVLPYDKNRVKIIFHVNGYYPEDELLFEYRLLGLNEEWIKIDKNVNFVSFNSLPSKEYVFEMRVKNKNGKEFLSEKLQFKINQPYWKTWWFIAVIILVFFSLVVLFYRNKLAIKEKEKELALKNAKFENELAILKLENLKSQMNPHFIFNALNSIQEYIILNQKNLASSYLAKFADLIRAYLDHSSKGYISLQEEVECLDIYLQLEKLRFEEKFSYEIKNLVSNSDLKIPTMLIQPYVENAIKHGLLHKKDNRHIEILFEQFADKNMLKCIVLDNGIGREKALELRNKKHQSFATKANQNRLELLNFGKERKIGVTIDDLKNENNEPVGTKVTLLIPILK